MNPHLLLLEDDAALVDGLRYSLEKNGFSLEVARSVAQAKEAVKRNRFDLLILDVGLPDGTGFEICEMVRREKSSVPILFLTAVDEETSVIRGLDGGGDDYMTKPFRLGELCSRIRALLRRSEKCGMESGGLLIDLAGSRVYLDGTCLELTAAEYRLLCFLVKNKGQVLTRAAILDALWDGNGNFVDDNTLSVYIRRLREKVEKDPSAPVHLRTVRGFGYEWKDE